MYLRAVLGLGVLLGGSHGESFLQVHRGPPAEPDGGPFGDGFAELQSLWSNRTHRRPSIKLGDDTVEDNYTQLHTLWPAPPDYSNVEHNDLWAIRDLLLIGYSGVMMGNESWDDLTEIQRDAKAEIRKSAHALAALLPSLHPYRPCRDLIASALARGVPGEEETLIMAARASWECLPANFTVGSMNNSFHEDMVHNWTAAYQARMPWFWDDGILGACQGSLWGRTCSYWLSLHIMAYRADALGKSRELLEAVFPLLAGGATMCAGCTLHLQALNKPVLHDAVLKSFGNEI